MKFGTLLKIAALLTVLAIVAFTGMLAYHTTIRPLDGIFTQWIPTPGSTSNSNAETADSVAKMLEASEMPDIDPGERAFQKAHELLALGKIPEARAKLMSIIHIYPLSSSAPTARHIIGGMNLDEILSPSFMEGKCVHTVKRGESWNSITTRYQSSIESTIWLNSMMDLRQLQVDDELVIMPLHFRLLLEPRRKSVSIWQQGKFICEYTAIEFPSQHLPPQLTQIQSKSSEIETRPAKPGQREFINSSKSLRVAKTPISLRSWNGTANKPRNAILLDPPDLEEIFLLTRVGTEVEIR